MAMYCPQCSTSFEQRLQCPTCGLRLVVAESQRTRRFGLFARGWQHTSWGRVVISLMLAQGLFYGLRHLLTGVLLALQDQGSVQESLATLPGLIGVQVLQVMALLLGGLLVGAGRRNALVLGFALGGLNGAVAVLAQQWPATASHSLLPVYYQPLIQGFVGAFGGWLGGTIWKPLAVVLRPQGATGKRKVLPQPTTSMFAGRIHWLRVLCGATFAIVGCLSATYLLDRAILVSNGGIEADSYLQEKVVTWEIKALATLLGGALAGACATNGFKQGLLTGVLTGAALNVALAFRAAHLDVVALTMLSSLSLSLAGGWFGGQLFPPTSPYKRQKGMGPASISH